MSEDKKPSEWAMKMAGEMLECLEEARGLLKLRKSKLIELAATFIDEASEKEREACCRDVCIFCKEHEPGHSFQPLAHPARMIVHKGEDRWMHVAVKDADRSFACGAEAIRSRGKT